jgi:hypothetical protein
MLSVDVMGFWPATVHENARSALECGSLLPPSPRPACWPGRRFMRPKVKNGCEQAHGIKAASKLALERSEGLSHSKAPAARSVAGYFHAKW